jgi:hypothetical protein
LHGSQERLLLVSVSPPRDLFPTFGSHFLQPFILGPILSFFPTKVWPKKKKKKKKVKIPEKFIFVGKINQFFR